MIAVQFKKIKTYDVIISCVVKIEAENPGAAMEDLENMIESNTAPMEIAAEMLETAGVVDAFEAEYQEGEPITAGADE